MRLLGPVHWEVDRVPRALPPAPSLLLAVLTLARGHPVDSSRLTAALWGEHPPATSESALRVHLTALRKVVGAPRLQRTEAGYRLDLSDVWIDVTELAECEQAVSATGDRGAAARGLALWRGQSLANVRRLPGGEPLALGLDNRRSALTTAWRSLVLRDGDGATITAELEAELAEGRLDEQRWAQLAHAQYQRGGSHEALHTLRRARNELVERAGLDPAPVLREIEERILRHDPTLSGTSAAGPVASVSRDRAVPVSLRWRRPDPFVGRAAELDLLAGCWREVVDTGGPTVVVVRGPGGMGKTSLAAEAAWRLSPEARVVHVELSDTSPPFTLLTQLRRHLPADETATAQRLLDSVIRPDSDAASLATPSDLTTMSVDLVAGLGRTPTMLVIDGVEWLDEFAASALEGLAHGHSAPGSLLVVGLERDESPSRLQSPSIIRVLLEPLDAGPIEGWLRAVGSDRAAADVHREAGGVPLLVALAIEHRGDWNRRLQSVSAHARRTAVVAALLGTRTSFELVRTASGLEDLELLDDIDGLQRAGVLSVSMESDHLQMAHDLVRAAILDECSEFLLQRTSALVVSRVGPASLGPTLTLDLCRRAGSLVDADVTIAATVDVARLRLAAFDFHGAKADIELTLRSIEAGRQRWPLLAPWARANLALGEHDSAGEALAELRQAVTEGAPAEIEAQVLSLEFNLGAGGTAKPDVVERLRAVAPAIATSLPQIARSLRRRLVIEYLNLGRPADAAQVVGELAEEGTGNADLEADLVPLHHLLATAAGDHATAAQVFQQAQSLRGEALGPRGRTSLSMFFAGHEVQNGDAAALALLCEELAANSAAAGEVHARWWAEALGFTPLFWNADLAAAAAACDQARQFGQARLVRTAPEVWAAQRVLLAWAEGALPSLLATLGDGPVPVSWRAVRALAHASAGDRAASAADVQSVERSLAAGEGGFLAASAAAFAIEAAHVLGTAGEVVESRRVLEQHVGPRCGFAGLVDLGPVDRYLALCELPESPAAAQARLTRVIDDPASTTIWRRRATIDAGRADAAAGAWDWLR